VLTLNNIFAGYTTNNMVLKGITLSIKEDEVIALIGQNGSGKSTLAKSILNIVPQVDGDILFMNEFICGKTTAQISNMGIGYFMQGGKIFPSLTVDENLDFAGHSLHKVELVKRKRQVQSYFELFSKNNIENQKASHLSGGEKNQLALSMSLMLKPRILILDEPSAGLSPRNVEQMYMSLEIIKKEDVKSILLIEQNVISAVKFSDKVILLSEGEIKNEKNCEELNSDKKIDEFFFGNIN
jgi:branched-chain amino acid transport system ATP-binding protein